LTDPVSIAASECFHERPHAQGRQSAQAGIAQPPVDASLDAGDHSARAGGRPAGPGQLGRPVDVIGSRGVRTASVRFSDRAR